MSCLSSNKDSDRLEQKLHNQNQIQEPRINGCWDYRLGDNVIDCIPPTPCSHLLKFLVDVLDGSGDLSASFGLLEQYGNLLPEAAEHVWVGRERLDLLPQARLHSSLSS